MALNPTILSHLEYQYFDSTFQTLWLKCLKFLYVVGDYIIIIFSTLKIFIVKRKIKLSLILSGLLNKFIYPFYYKTCIQD